MKLTARITQLDFRPYDYVKVQGWAHSNYDRSKICGDKHEFELGWFWREDMPKEIKKVLLAVERDVAIQLQERGVIPKRWPGKLANDIDDGVFTFKLNQFVIRNANWNVGGIESYVNVIVQSKMHNDGKAITSKVNLNITKEYNKILFKILDENL